MDDDAASGRLGTTSWSSPEPEKKRGPASRDARLEADAASADRPEGDPVYGALEHFLFGGPGDAKTGVSYNDYMASHEANEKRRPPDKLADYEANEDRYADDVTLNRDGTCELDDQPDFCTMSCGVPTSFIS